MKRAHDIVNCYGVADPDAEHEQIMREWTAIHKRGVACWKFPPDAIRMGDGWACILRSSDRQNKVWYHVWYLYLDKGTDGGKGRTMEQISPKEARQRGTRLRSFRNTPSFQQARYYCEGKGLTVWPIWNGGRFALEVYGKGTGKRYKVTVFHGSKLREAVEGLLERIEGRTKADGEKEGAE